MELSPKQQIVELFRKSEDILLVTHSNPGGDAIGSLLALERVLTEVGKKVRVVVTEKIPLQLHFLPGIDKIKSEIKGNTDLILRVNTENVEIGKILTQGDNKYLDITVVPKKGALKEDDVAVLKSRPKYDCIVVLDTPDVDKIDKLYDSNTELFFETPIINIDHHSGNEYFGTINLVELTATSTSEILVSIIEALGKTKIDEDTATCLLAGITADTGSFKSINTTPKSLTVAAQLLAAGARQQEIIQNFYKTKSLRTLKLWGKTLLNVRSNPELRIVWSSVRYKDLSDLQVSPEEAKEVLDDLLANTPGADVVCLIIEVEPNNFSVKLKGVKGSDVLEIAEVFGGSGHALSAGFEIKNVAFEAAEFQVLKVIQDIRGKKIGRIVQMEKTPEPTVGEELLDEKIESKTEEKSAEAKDQRLDEKTLTSEFGALEKVQDGDVPETLDSVEISKEETENREGKNDKDAITRALESLEAAKAVEEQKELEDENDNLQSTQTDSLTPISELIKKFTPGQIKENKEEDKLKSDE